MAAEWPSFIFPARLNRFLPNFAGRRVEAIVYIIRVKRCDQMHFRDGVTRCTFAIGETIPKTCAKASPKSSNCASLKLPVIGTLQERSHFPFNVFFIAFIPIELLVFLSGQQFSAKSKSPCKL